MNSRLEPPRSESRQRLRARGLEMDLDLFTVRFGSSLLSLTAREFDVLKLLLSETDRILSRDEIHRRIWTSGGTGMRVVDTYVSRLRSKLREAGHPGIGVVQMRGYRLLEPDGVPVTPGE